MNIQKAINELAGDFALTNQTRKLADFDAIFRAIVNDILINEEFDIVLDDMIHKFARDLDESIFYNNDIVIFDELEIGRMIAEKIGDLIC